jgi:diadenosine tetraphosphate (Ap4A) HIT family hydrolase
VPDRWSEASVLLGVGGLAAPSAAQGVIATGSGRARATVAGLVALIGVVTGGLALARSAARIGMGNGRDGAIARGGEATIPSPQPGDGQARGEGAIRDHPPAEFMTRTCEACSLTNGDSVLPGGRVFQTTHWVVEHCIGALGVGTLIVKPFRHTLHLSDLRVEEAAELGSLLQRTAQIIQGLAAADQVYACLWSHSGWEPVHIHFVLQPSWNALRERYPGPGPFLQTSMFRAGEPLDARAVEQFCDQARRAFQVATPSSSS